MSGFCRLLGYLRPYLGRVIFSYVCMVAIAAAGLAIPDQLGRVVDEGIVAGSRQALLRGVIIVLALNVGRAILTFAQGYFTEVISQGTAYDLRNEIYEKLHRLSFSFYDRAETGQLLARATSDVEMTRRITGRPMLMLINGVITAIGTAIIMISVNAPLALISLALMPLFLWVVQKYALQNRPLTLVAQNRLALLTSRLEQNLRGLAVVRAFAQEPAEIQRFEQENTTLFDDNMAVVNLGARRQPQIRILVDLSTVILLLAGGYMVIRAGLTLGELVAFNAYLLNLVQPLRRFGFLTSMVSSSTAAAERAFEILDLPEEVQDVPGAPPLPPLQGHVEFRDVTFSYVTGQPVLDGVSFTIEPGTTVAVLGPTGSGKSTVINLLMRFYDPKSGQVLVDGHDISQATAESLRQQVGLVLQETMLFAGTVRENIAFGKDDATDEEIEAAARSAAAHDFITELPEGYDTIVGERGITLSGGQRQRVAIARAILKDPRILVLDDATSSVDSQTELLIQEALWRLMPGRTSFVIAQRVSTARRADVILLLDKGKLADMGSHEELLERSGLYSDIYHSQLLPERRAEVVEAADEVSQAEAAGRAS